MNGRGARRIGPPPDPRRRRTAMFAHIRQHVSRRIVLFAVLAAVTALVAQAKAPGEATDGFTQPEPLAKRVAPRPRIDVVFALDTTGSMSGLIEGAKQKIWSVASAMADGRPTPQIRIGLVGYRDRGDDYVTRTTDLTEDIDAVYAHLQAFSAGGGGDNPESVNQALHEAVARMSWSGGNDVYKVVFLVGDAPPHMDYDNDVKYAETVDLARAKGIAINTIQCGTQSDTAQIWREIARRGSGQFVSIRQNGAMVALETPMDEDLARLNAEIAGTVLAYGDADDRAEVERKVAASKAAAPAVTASRLGYLSKSGGRVNSGRRDLVDAVKEGSVEADTVAEDALPSEMQAMNAAERRGYVQAKIEERGKIQARIDELSRKRDAYLRAETERLAAEGRGDGFDQQVLKTIRQQAATKGIRYE
jgi:Mg-chelatase subunit ChlD